MKNFIQVGAVLSLLAPYALAAGDGFQVGTSIFAVAGGDALNGAAVDGHVEGVFELTKIGSQAWAVGDPVYWDNGNKRCTLVPQGNLLIGQATAIVAGGAGDTKGAVRLFGSALAAGVTGLAGGYKIARGQHTTVAADDTLVTGLATVVSVVAQLDDDPVAGAQHVTSSIGDQAGAPAAGSVQIKTWKATAAGDTALIAATTFGKKVNWIAVGT